ncbi:uncharacterized protein LOC143212284 [Lasioglossum baleicum]|uniref:uncharacterized protein LOC143212284 n=1 Tax=Lasioglossum baleicum TaxID=434251 RepID=UPI003FCE4832
MCSRSFGTGISRTYSSLVSFNKELNIYARLQQRRFSKSNKKDPTNCPPKFAPDSRKSGGSQTCTPRAPPCCRKRPKNPKCEACAPPCPPPCPCPCPPPPPKAPPPKICYRKCPPPPKPPKLPKCPKIPAPPPPPPLPKIPRPPKCPKPCPPPPPPPLPRCPQPPTCPECPPQRVCPPPPPCEPCPCPPPCPPPCCPPPPPCPMCPPPIPCPKPLPCPPPPPKVCPPCPPCAECPKPPPCPPPPPCCPCPCPEPPPPCPCPKPCPPCPQTPPACPKDVPSCPKCEAGGGRSGKGNRRMSTYHGGPWHLINRKLHVHSVLLGKPRNLKKPNCQTVEDICKKQTGKECCAKTCETWGGKSEAGILKRNMSTYLGSHWHLTSRRLHVHSILMGKSSKPKQPTNCKTTDDICKKQTGKGSCVQTCDKKSECNTKKPVCGDQKKKPKKKKKKKKKKKELCPDTCIPRGKCDQPNVPSLPKMDYAPAKCPKPKFVILEPCPEVPQDADEICSTRSDSTTEEAVCSSRPLPKAPSDPVILCPCPPPPKLHPGPCPCYTFSKEVTQAIPLPPCPHKEKYVCCKDSFYCIQEQKLCKMDNKGCEKRMKRQEKKKKKP